MVSTKARKQKTRSKTPPKTAPTSPARARTDVPAVAFSRINAIYLSAGVMAIAVGFFLLAQGSMVLAPILLVLGYCVLLPIGIIKK